MLKSLLNKILSIRLNRQQIEFKKKIVIPEYLCWLQYANVGMLNVGNIEAFDYVFKHLKSENPVLEIGSFCGLSTNVINYYLSLNGKHNTLITADKWFFEGAENQFDVINSKITHKDYREFVKENYVRNITFFSKENLPYTIEEFSDDFFIQWGNKQATKDILGREIVLGGQFSFVYIDGNHSYDYAKRDFINADKYLEKGGFILFDDSGDNTSWDVCKVIDEIKNNKKYKIIMNNPNYLVMKIAD